MIERHTLYSRPSINDEPKKVREFQTYQAALKAGMRECGHGKFWVESEKKEPASTRWTEFVPDMPHVTEVFTEKDEDDSI